MIEMDAIIHDAVFTSRSTWKFSKIRYRKGSKNVSHPRRYLKEVIVGLQNQFRMFEIQFKPLFTVTNSLQSFKCIYKFSIRLHTIFFYTADISQEILLLQSFYRALMFLRYCTNSCCQNSLDSYNDTTNTNSHMQNTTACMHARRTHTHT